MVRPGGAIEMQEAVALGAERAAGAAVDHGRRGAVVVVGAVRSRLAALAPARLATFAAHVYTATRNKH